MQTHQADIAAEKARAIQKFPLWPTDPLHAFGIVQEEAGEVQKAILQSCYEPHKSDMASVYHETIQLAAMVERFLESFDAYEVKAGEQHRQA